MKPFPIIDYLDGFGVFAFIFNILTFQFC